MLHLSTNGNGREYDLNSLPVGGRFRTTNPYAAPTYGTLVEIGPGSCIVRLDRAVKHVSIRTGNGESVDFDSARARTTRWQPLTPVEYLNEIEHDVLQNSHQGDDTTMASAARKLKSTATARPAKAAKPAKAAVVPITADPKSRALAARWKLAVTKLGQLLSVDGPTAATTAQRDLVRAIYDEAVIAQVMLPVDPVTYKDPVFKEMELGATSGFEGTGAAASTPTPSQAKKGTADSQDGGKKKTAKASAKTPKPRAAKKAKAADNDCKDGCGAKVAGRFKQGHDAKYRGLILAVERGEAKESDLPSLMRRQGGKDDGPLTFRKLAGDSGFKCTNSAVSH